MRHIPSKIDVDDRSVKMQKTAEEYNYYKHTVKLM